ncbi:MULTISPECIES: M48 family metalloprotease [Nonlabens]|uniref:Gll1625 protein n=1 Tax=Nonlabens ulvanivorans TaxID=906888 RepID=A0A084JSX3_NONUL|nr:M48 family metalloprotease [Nonlabens ulvanivorans]KEZ92057.1 peptidase M48 Ste24p [Nonlabens ulvanivorans]PRX14885.1 peptidase M48-like protein [Nonlabens ulvanivorans]WOI22749.1 M48 family metalloprotease [Nonlabens ulvanivorans]GAK75280.1 Gll1625 protein [Nonlabens ulvanivorans]GAK99161.1 Gll1625 protein [Nonlabens ulvanivorans]
MRGGSGKIRLFIGLAIVAFAVLKYCSSAETNNFTGETQYVDLSTDQEIAMGLSAAPSMIAEYGGLHPDQNAQAQLDRVGKKLVNSSIGRNTDYQYDFHLLADDRTINAFALPGGQCFITAALYSQLENEDQLAGVMGHEIGHVIARHSAERMSQQGLAQGVITGVSVGTDGGGEAAASIAQMLTMKYGRDDELQSDDLGVKMMIDAGYDPYEMIGVMEILKNAAGPNRAPEFQSTHPDPENRVERIKEAIRKYGK